ncbi:hypothetical protein Ancab_010849 [Ancistrocladus abbreviatus]
MDQSMGFALPIVNTIATKPIKMDKVIPTSYWPLRRSVTIPNRDGNNIISTGLSAGLSCYPRTVIIYIPGPALSVDGAIISTNCPFVLLNVSITGRIGFVM